MEAATIDADNYPGVEEEVVGELKEPYVLESGGASEEGKMRQGGEVYFELAMRGDKDGGVLWIVLRGITTAPVL